MGRIDIENYHTHNSTIPIINFTQEDEYTAVSGPCGASPIGTLRPVRPPGRATRTRRAALARNSSLRVLSTQHRRANVTASGRWDLGHRVAAPVELELEHLIEHLLL
jgi:hypothetical protein